MPAYVPICIWCEKRQHYHCDGLRFTASGTPFKPSPMVSCSCKVCDHIRERWLYCDKCMLNLAAPGLRICHVCHSERRT